MFKENPFHSTPQLSDSKNNETSTQKPLEIKKQPEAPTPDILSHLNVSLERNREKIQEYSYQANRRNKNRSMKEKLLGRNKIGWKTIAAEREKFLKNRISQLIQDGKESEIPKYVKNFNNNTLTEEKINEFEDTFVAASPVRKEAFRTGDFIPMFKQGMRGCITNPIALRLYATTMCKNGFTENTADTFFQHPELRHFLLNEQLLVTLASMDISERDKYLEECVENHIISAQDTGTLRQEVLRLEAAFQRLNDKLNIFQWKTNARVDNSIHERSQIRHLSEGINVFRKKIKVRPLQEIPSLKQYATTGETFPEEKRQILLNLYMDNYSDTKGYSQTFRDKLREKMLASFSNKNIVFHVVELHGSPITYLSVENKGQQNDGRSSKYFGMFNADPEIQGCSVGTQLLSEVLKNESRDSVIHCHADPKSPIFSSYINKFGFIGIDSEYFADRKLIALRLDPQENQQYIMRNPALKNEFDERLSNKSIIAEEITPPEIEFYDHAWALTRIDLSVDKKPMAVFEKVPETSHS